LGLIHNSVSSSSSTATFPYPVRSLLIAQISCEDASYEFRSVDVFWRDHLLKFTNQRKAYGQRRFYLAAGSAKSNENEATATR
jgi:hypothetical protein